MRQEKICEQCGDSKSIVGGYAVLDIGIKDDDIEFDDVCRDCRKNNKKEEPVQEGKARKNRGDESDEDEHLHQVGCSFASLVSGDLRILESYTPQKLYESIPSSMEHKYEDVLAEAKRVIYEGRGLAYPELLKLDEGNYIVIGHASGCYAEASIVSCVEHMCNYLDATPIHVGPLLDAQGFHCEKLLKLPGLIVVADLSEIYKVGKLQEEFGFTMVRYGVEIAGDTIVKNQYYRENPFTVSSSKGIQVLESHSNVIMPRTLLELHAKTKHGRTQVIATTGCICAKHQFRKPPKKARATNIEDAINKFYDGTRSGRRQKETMKNWKNGAIVVQAAGCGRAICIPCEFKQHGKEYVTGYYDVVFTSSGVREPEKTGLVIGDVHVPLHDPKAISVVENVANIIKPDYLVNIGDHVNNSSVNHHKMDRGQPIVDEDFVNEYAQASQILEHMSKWAPELYIMFGNHERFLDDFIQKYPQLKNLFDRKRLLRTDELGYKAYEEKTVLHIEDMKFIHGEMRCYGAMGDRNKKTAGVFGEGVVAGHCHTPSTRGGSHYIGLLGKLDQEYNEPNASNWMHGFATVCHYQGMSFLTVATIVEYMTFYGQDVISASDDVSKWMPENFSVRYSYEERE